MKKNLAMQQTDQTKKQQKRIPQITTRLEQIDKVLNKLYEDNALGTIPQDRYEQMSAKIFGRILHTENGACHTPRAAIRL